MWGWILKKIVRPLQLLFQYIEQPFLCLVQKKDTAGKKNGTLFYGIKTCTVETFFMIGDNCSEDNVLSCSKRSEGRNASRSFPKLSAGNSLMRFPKVSGDNFFNKIFEFWR